MKTFARIIAILAFVTPFSSFAAIGTETLPQGVRSSSLRYGMISQLDQKYTQSGTLARTIDLRSIEFNAKRLAQIQPRIQELVGLFNRMGRYDLGSALNLGTLRIDSRPEVQYTGAIFAYGLSDRWTIGGGLPVIRYKNNIQISKTASNIKAFQEITAGLGVREVDEGLSELANTDLVSEFHSELSKKGYEPLENQDQTFLGDVQVSSLYKFESVSNIDSQMRVNLSLPTGPKYNPDNLAALNQFGYTYIEPQIVAAAPLILNFRLAGLLGVRLHMPDDITVRVPKDEEDLLPDASQKENVRRQTGTKFTEAVQLSYQFNEYLSSHGAFELSQKAQDRFTGSQDRRYDLLSNGTDTQTQILTGGISFSSVEAYQKRQKGIPAVVSVQVSDTIAGRNIERQLVSEMNAMIFF